VIAPATAAPDAAALAGQLPARAAHPQDLFAALLDLLSALPLPVAEGALPDAPPQEEAEPERADERGAEQVGAEAAALAVLAQSQAPRESARPQPQSPVLERPATDARREPIGAPPLPVAARAHTGGGEHAEERPLEPRLTDAEPAAPAPNAPQAEPAPLAANAPPIPLAANEDRGAPASVSAAVRNLAVHAPTKIAPHAPRELPAEPRPEHAPEPVPLDVAPAAPRSDASPASPLREPVANEAPARVLPSESARPVVQNVVFLAEHGGGSARMTLNPPELGPVEIVVRVRGNQVEVHVRAEESAAQQVVRDSRDSLSEALASRELRMDGFSVGSGGAGSAGNEPRDAARDGAQQAPAPAPRDAEARSAMARTAAPTFTGAPSGAIDLRV
jgi:hypothetical protein